MVVTDIELIPEHPDYYRVTFNKIWRLINSYWQIEKSANNWDEIKSILLPIERKKKIYRIMNKKNKIYKVRLLYKNLNY